MSQDPHHTPEVHEQPDPWHDHTREEPKPEHEHAARVNSVGLFIAFIVTVVGVVATVVVVSIYFLQTVQDHKAKVIEVSVWAEESWAERDAQLALLNDPSQTMDGYSVEVALDEAMDRVAEEYGTE